MYTLVTEGESYQVSKRLLISSELGSLQTISLMLITNIKTMLRTAMVLPRDQPLPNEFNWLSSLMLVTCPDVHMYNP